jgi:hypothetical protein
VFCATSRALSASRPSTRTDTSSSAIHPTTTAANSSWDGLTRPSQAPCQDHPTVVAGSGVGRGGTGHRMALRHRDRRPARATCPSWTRRYAPSRRPATVPRARRDADPDRPGRRRPALQTRGRTAATG